MAYPINAAMDQHAQPEEPAQPAQPAQLAQPDVERENRSDFLWFLIRFMVISVLCLTLSFFLPSILPSLGITSSLITEGISVVIGGIVFTIIVVDNNNLQRRITERNTRGRIGGINGRVLENESRRLSVDVESMLRRRFRIGNIAEGELGQEINRYKGVPYMLLNYDRLVGFIKENEEVSNLVFPGTSIENEGGKDFINCPISRLRLQKPAMVYCGHVIDEEYLKGWLNRDHFTCPCCRRDL